jgi:hypothetical protein
MIHERPSHSAAGKVLSFPVQSRRQRAGRFSENINMKHTGCQQSRYFRTASEQQRQESASPAAN